MRLLSAAIVAIAVSACSPAPAPKGTEVYPTGSAPAPANADWGPYANSWDAAEFSRFRHTLNARASGPHTLTLSALTNSPGGETVAVYPIGPDGERQPKLMFVIASTRGESVAQAFTFPTDGASVPVEVVVENASGNRYAGSYTLTIAP